MIRKPVYVSKRNICHLVFFAFKFQIRFGFYNYLVHRLPRKDSIINMVACEFGSFG